MGEEVDEEESGRIRRNEFLKKGTVQMSSQQRVTILKKHVSLIEETPNHVIMLMHAVPLVICTT